MLKSPSHAVVGAIDPELTARFLGRFGFEVRRRATLPREAAGVLYGLESEAAEVLLAVPGAENGWIRLVETPHVATTPGPYDSRPLAIDLYTRDVERSLEIAEQAGGSRGSLVERSAGLQALKQARVTGPDRLTVVFIEIDPRRPSVLDHDASRLHSEVHSIVWVVASTEETLPFWSGPAGLDTLVDSKLEGSVISELMDLPQSDVATRSTLLSDAEARPARFELLEFTDDPGAVQATWPLAGGLHAPAWSVDDLATALGRLAGVEAGPTVGLDTAVHRRARGLTAVAPGGVRLELWQEDHD